MKANTITRTDFRAACVSACMPLVKNEVSRHQIATERASHALGELIRACGAGGVDIADVIRSYGSTRAKNDQYGRLDLWESIRQDQKILDALIAELEEFREEYDSFHESALGSNPMQSFYDLPDSAKSQACRRIARSRVKAGFEQKALSYCNNLHEVGERAERETVSWETDSAHESVSA